MTLIRVGVGSCAALLLGSLLPASALGPLVDDSESYPNGSVIIGQNTGAGGTGILGESTTNGGTGIVGMMTATSATGGVGVRGSASGPSAYGVYGIGSTPDSTRPSIGVYGTSTGTYGIYGATKSATVPSILGYNFNSTTGIGLEGYGSGNGVLGISANLNGVVGQTFYKSGQGGTGFAGVYGADQSGDSGVGNSGVAGLSVSGYGVSGTARSGTGLAGFSTSGVGVYGTSTSSFGVYGVSPKNIGIEGQSRGGIGIVAQTLATPSPGGANGPAALLVSTDGGSPAMKVSSSSGDIMSLDAKGNLIVAGNITVDGNLSVAGSSGACPSCVSPLMHEQKTASNASIGTYDSQQTVRTIEDVGEAQLVDGHAFVRLDDSFGAVTDPRSTYLVFITPQGETQGLYVTQKTRAGFTVREIGNGRSSLAFDYRISAKPYGSSEARLPLLAARQGGLERPLHTSSDTLRLARFPLQREPSQAANGAGFIPRVRIPEAPQTNLK